MACEQHKAARAKLPVPPENDLENRAEPWLCLLRLHPLHQDMLHLKCVRHSQQRGRA